MAELQNLLHKLILAGVIGDGSKIELYADGSGALLNIDTCMDDDDATIFAEWSKCFWALSAIKEEMKWRSVCMPI